MKLIPAESTGTGTASSQLSGFLLLEKFHVIPWLMIEFGFYALWTFFYFAAAVAAAVQVPWLSDNQIFFHFISVAVPDLGSGAF
jgi:hypothetical protein